jgi:hypothetical protein
MCDLISQFLHISSNYKAKLSTRTLSFYVKKFHYERPVAKLFEMEYDYGISLALLRILEVHKSKKLLKQKGYQQRQSFICFPNYFP